MSRTPIFARAPEGALRLVRSRARGRASTTLAACVLLLAGCALLGKSEPLKVRYFEVADDGPYDPAELPVSQRLRLGAVSAARHIDQRIVSRQSENELTYYEEWRWTEQPDVYLRRTLSRNLYERAGLTRVVSGVANTLEVELTAFEERKRSGGARARVALLASLHDDRIQLWQRSIDVEVEVGAGDPAQALASALGKALARAAAQVSEQTVVALASLGSSAEPRAATRGPSAEPAPTATTLP